MNILKFENVKKTFKNSIALNGLDFGVQTGEIHALIGHNGSGKTTSFLISNRLIDFDSGIVELFGENISTIKNKKLQKIGLLTEKLKFYKDFTVKEIINFFCDIYKIDKTTKKFGLIYELFNIEEILKKTMKSLSTGMYKKATIVFTLINEPELIFLDEPFSGLDIMAIKELSNAIKEYNRQFSTTFIISSHNLPEIEAIADKSTIIKEGRRVATGTLSEMLNNIGIKKNFKIQYHKDNILNSMSVEEESGLISAISEIKSENGHIIEINENKIGLTDIYQHLYQ